MSFWQRISLLAAAWAVLLVTGVVLVVRGLWYTWLYWPWLALSAAGFCLTLGTRRPDR